MSFLLVWRAATGQTRTCELCNGLGTTAAATRVNNLYLSVGQETWEMNYIIDWRGVICGSSGAERAAEKYVHALGPGGPETSRLHSPGEADFKPQVAMRDPVSPASLNEYHGSKNCPRVKLRMLDMHKLIVSQG